MSKFERARAVLHDAMGSKRSSFYRDFYSRKQFDISHMPATTPEWQQLPLLAKADIVAVPFLERLFMPIEETGMMHFTSGTSNSGIVVLPRRLPLPAAPEAPFYRGSALMSFHFSALTCTRKNTPPTIIAGDRTELEASAALAAQAGIDALDGPASLLIAFVPYLRVRGVHERIRYLTLVSERVSPLQLEALRECYPNAVILNIFYGMQEVGRIAHTAPGMGDAFLLSLLPNYYVELLGEDGAHALDNLTEPREGEILITTLYPEPFPLIRYRSGDRARTVLKDGRVFIQMLGRAQEERVRISGGELVLAELERAIAASAEHLVADFECVIGEEKRGSAVVTTLALTLYMNESGTPLSAHDVAGRIASTLRVNQQRVWADGVALGLYAPIVCVCAPLRPASAKRKHLVDTRR